MWGMSADIRAHVSELLLSLGVAVGRCQWQGAQFVLNGGTDI